MDGTMERQCWEREGTSMPGKASRAGVGVEAVRGGESGGSSCMTPVLLTCLRIVACRNRF